MDATRSLFDMERLAAAKPEVHPFPFLVVPSFLRDEALPAVEADFPAIVGPRNHRIGAAPHGPAFGRLLDALASTEFASCLGAKLGVPGLEQMPQNVSVRAECEASDGHIHTDHWSKRVTVLLYPNRTWSAVGGRLRLLRSQNLEDYAAEVPPVGGVLVAFRRSARSFHGHDSHVGPRRVVQVSWLRPSPIARLLQGIARRATHARKRVGLHADH